LSETLSLFNQGPLEEAVAALRTDLLAEGGPQISTMRNYRFAILPYRPVEEFKLRQLIRRLTDELRAEGWVILPISLQKLLLGARAATPAAFTFLHQPETLPQRGHGNFLPQQAAHCPLEEHVMTCDKAPPNPAATKSPAPTKKALNQRAFVALVVLLAGVTLPLTGLANHLYQLAPITGSRHRWMAVHDSAGLLFVVFAVWHVVLNRRAIWNHVRGLAAQASLASRELLWATVLVSAVLALAVGHTLHAG
jgi:hypothetical protein